MKTLASLRDDIAAQLLGRDREASIITLALIAREHVLLVGPPGTGKSQLCRAAAHLVDGARFCERLLSPTTPPEAIWGPVSISALREDRYEHVTAGYAADAHVLYLDEVGRASPAILDTMLDRWTLRASVQYLSAGMRRSLLTFNAPAMSPVATLTDLDSANQALASISWSAAAIETLDLILNDLDEAGIAVSDRRLRSADKIARAAAVLRGATVVEMDDLEALQWVLWSVPDQAATAAQKVLARANPIGSRLEAMLVEVDELTRAAVDAPTRVDAVAKLEAIMKEAEKIASEVGGNGRAAKVVQFIKREHMRLYGVSLGLSPDKIEKLLAA